MDYSGRVRTAIDSEGPSQGCNTGSNPVGSAIKSISYMFCVMQQNGLGKF